MARTPLELRQRYLVVAATIGLAVLLGPLGWPRELHPPLAEGEPSGPELWSFAASIGFFLRDIAPPVLAVFLAHGLVHGRPIATLGFRAPLARHLFIGLGIGMLMQGAKTLLVLPSAGEWVLERSIPSGAPLVSVAAYFCAHSLLWVVPSALLEELVFRSYPIEQFRDRPRQLVRVVVAVSLAFSAVHFIHGPFSLFSALSYFLSGLVYSYLYVHWRSIWLVAGAHAGNNLFIGAVWSEWDTGGLWLLCYSGPSQSMLIASTVVVSAAALLLMHHHRRRTRRWRGPVRPYDRS